MKLSDLSKMNTLHKKLAELKRRRKIFAPYKNLSKEEEGILSALDSEIKVLEEKILFL